MKLLELYEPEQLSPDERDDDSGAEAVRSHRALLWSSIRSDEIAKRAPRPDEAPPTL
jgi:hypothetical protein